MKILTFVCSSIDLHILKTISESLDKDHGERPEITYIYLESWMRRGLSITQLPYYKNHVELICKNPYENNIWESKKVYTAFLAEKECFQKNLGDVIKTQKFDVFLIQTDDGVMEAEMIRIANQYSIPTVFISHGYTPPYYKGLRSLFRYYLNIFTKSQSLKPYGLNGCKTIISINSDQQRWFCKRAILRAKILNLGYAYADSLFNFCNKNNIAKPLELKKALIISNDPSSFGDIHQDFLIKKIIPYFQKNNIELKILLKPGETDLFWRQHINNDEIEILQNPSSLNEKYQLINRYDCFIGTTSQLIFEAYIMKKIIVIYGKKGNDPFHLVKMNQCNYVDQSDGIGPINNLVVKTSAINRLIKKNWGNFDGKRSYAIAKQLIKIIR